MEVKPVVITAHAVLSLHREFEYHKENISPAFAYKLRSRFTEYVDSLPQNYLHYPACRFLPTKNQIYRNIIRREYLIVYKILKEELLVLGIFHAKQNPAKLKAYGKIQ